MTTLAWNISLFAASAALAAALFLMLSPAAVRPSPEGGERGRRRKEALEKGGFFKIVEPLLRMIATRMAAVPVGGLRAKLEERLARAGRPLGLDADDFLALCAMSGAAAGVFGAALCDHLGRGPGAGAIVGIVLGASTPWFRLEEFSKKRRITIGRSLPQAVDLIALSMEAGLDFSGALRQVLGQLQAENPIGFEFENILRRLSLGWSRRAALEEFAARVPTAPVRQFVSSVVQAEKRGTPLAQVLATQADVMRTKRSQAAEQAAARAAVLILGPLMLIFACVFLILLGPFAIKFMRGEMF